jgi:hypothetical protein
MVLLLDAYVIPALLFAAVGLLSTLLMRNTDLVGEAVDVLIPIGLAIWIPSATVAVILYSALPDSSIVWTDALAVAYILLYWLCIVLILVIYLVAAYNLVVQKVRGVEWRLDKALKDADLKKDE